MTTQFQVGATYTCRSICDWECIFSFEVLKRTTKTITIRAFGKEVRRTISVYDGVEQVAPHGRFSMSPILTAKSN
jgi:hypothetical protein